MLGKSPVRESLLNNEVNGKGHALSSSEAKDDEEIGVRNFSIFDDNNGSRSTNSPRGGRQKGLQQQYL